MDPSSFNPTRFTFALIVAVVFWAVMQRFLEWYLNVDQLLFEEFLILGLAAVLFLFLAFWKKKPRTDR
jgi:hypothetical protein